MSVNLKLVASVIGVTGAVGGTVGVILSQTGNTKEISAEVTSHNSPDVTTDGIDSEQTRSPEEPDSELTPEVKKGNCTVVDVLENGIFEKLGIQEEEYTAVYCENTDSENSESESWKKWTGLFHNSLFGKYDSLGLNTSFDLKTSSSLVYYDDDDDFETTFESTQFSHSPVVGVWGGAEENILNKSLTTVTVTSDEHGGDGKIYLFLKQKI